MIVTYVFFFAMLYYQEMLFSIDKRIDKLLCIESYGKCAKSAIKLSIAFREKIKKYMYV